MSQRLAAALTTWLPRPSALFTLGLAAGMAGGAVLALLLA